ncbi:hypothetical protein BraRD5C2_37970 [Bradyrhizobium sp. RD5-C2]|nr:hypothetical protein BraRD5C2_37970 [Bradyrhizobium sp. RD5-C2]
MKRRLGSCTTNVPNMVGLKSFLWTALIWRATDYRRGRGRIHPPLSGAVEAQIPDTAANEAVRENTTGASDNEWHAGSA